METKLKEGKQLGRFEVREGQLYFVEVKQPTPWSKASCQIGKVAGVVLIVVLLAMALISPVSSLLLLLVAYMISPWKVTVEKDDSK